MKTRLHPLIQENSRILFLIDYPPHADTENGVVLSGISKRQEFMAWICRETGLDINKVSFGATISCILESRSSCTTADYMNCAENIKEIIKSKNIDYVLAFGAMSYTSLTGLTVASIEKERGYLLDIPDTKAKIVLTYATNLLIDGEGCGACGRNVYRRLVKKDLNVILQDIKKHGQNI